jgi:hypothetical protein
MKICVIGNSHIAALKLALRDGAFASAALDVAFWGLPGRGYSEIRYEDGRLCAADRDAVLTISEGRYQTVDPDEFEALVFHGPPINPSRVLSHLRQGRSDIGGYSGAFLRDGLAAFFAGSKIGQIVLKVRNDYRGRVLVSPMAMISRQSRMFENQGVGAWEVAAINEAFAAGLSGFGLEFVPQPPATVVHNCYTDESYCIGSVRLTGELDQKHPADDYWHMNGLYGGAVLAAIGARLGC